MRARTTYKIIHYCRKPRKTAILYSLYIDYLAGMIMKKETVASMIDHTLLAPEAGTEKIRRLCADAKKYIGSPYVNGATGSESFDCSGFIYFIARKSLKQQLPRSAHAMYRFVEHISDDEIEAGDLLFFSASSSGRMTHVGLYIGEGKMMKFEDIAVRMPDNYDAYLTRVYGDYMTPPPIEERPSHHARYFVDFHRRLSVDEIQKIKIGK